MIRNTLAVIGTAALFVVLILVLALWHFGYVSKRVHEISTRIDRETAVVRAHAAINRIEEQADQQLEKTRHLRVTARAREIALERDEQSRSQIRAAIQALAQAAQTVGIQKPSTGRHARITQKTVSFAGRSYTASEVYETLEGWDNRVRQKTQHCEFLRSMVDRMRKAANQLDSQRDQIIFKVSALRSHIDKLRIQRDIVRLEKELTELQANARGIHKGGLGHALQAIRKEIDESLATIEVLSQEMESRRVVDGQPLVHSLVISKSAVDKLDKLWE